MPSSEPAPTRRRQHERSAQSAQRLLTAAIELIAEKGFERTKVGEIGERAGYSREMVRNRYGSKAQLLEALMETEYKARLLPGEPGRAGDPDGAGDPNDARDAGDPDDAPGRDRALRPLRLMAVMAGEEPELLRAFFVLSFESVGPVADLLPWMRGFFAELRTHVVTALRAGQGDGSVRRDLVVAAEAEEIIIRGIGLGFSWILEPEATSFADTLGAWIEQLTARWAPSA